jgi:NAD(P)H-dependent flavin oxidoreductase YrpB (nitropropane dioxygenase family)
MDREQTREAVRRRLAHPAKYVGSRRGARFDSLLGWCRTSWQWVADLLECHGVPELPAAADSKRENAAWRGCASTPRAAPLIDVSFDNKSLIASALGTPPSWLVDESHKRNVPVAALAGRIDHAAAHKEAGVDLIIAQGTEGGGHTGEIATMVLIPQVVDAVAPTPVLAAGGIASGRQIAAAMALGAEGVWCGSVWLTRTRPRRAGVRRSSSPQARVTHAAHGP